MPSRHRAATPDANRPDRRRAILLAAVRLFAQHGFHGVTIREIAAEAGVPLALVGYYFGQKHELFTALFAQWSGVIEERLSGLRAITIDPADAATLPRIIEAFVMPVIALRASEAGASYALLVARQLVQVPDEADAILSTHFDPLAHAFIDGLHAALPHASRGDVAWGYQFALGALLNHISDGRVERLSRGLNRTADPAAAPLLVRFIVGGLRAALPVPAGWRQPAAAVEGPAAAAVAARGAAEPAQRKAARATPAARNQQPRRQTA